MVREVAGTDQWKREVFCATVERGSRLYAQITPHGELFLLRRRRGRDQVRGEDRQHLRVPEAVERLAARAGIELRYEQGGHVPGQEQSQRRRLLEAHQAAADFYAERLRTIRPPAQRASSWPSGASSWPTSERFGVGYSAEAWEALTRHLRGRGFTDSRADGRGPASQGRRGPVDRFRGLADVADHAT